MDEKHTVEENVMDRFWDVLSDIQELDAISINAELGCNDSEAIKLFQKLYNTGTRLHEVLLHGGERVWTK